jgi:predicted house-cleaning noncanonical NTP pyrophosphatase (MazG superfamily)
VIKIYNKLVRDKTIEEIEADGRKANYRILAENELIEALGNKIVEEAEEVKEALKKGNLDEIKEELCDVSLVITYIILSKNITNEMLQLKVMEKLGKRGGYEKRIFLESVEE